MNFGNPFKSLTDKWKEGRAGQLARAQAEQQRLDNILAILRDGGLPDTRCPDTVPFQFTRD